MISTIELTEDMIKLISNIRFKECPDINSEKPELSWGIDFNSLYGGNFIFEDVSMILGIYDKHIEGTENNVMGPEFPDEYEDYMWDIHTYILYNIDRIETILHQFAGKGGLTPGKYVEKNGLWEKKYESN